LTEDEKALALEQYAAMARPPAPSKEHEMMNQELTDKLAALAELKKQGVSDDRLKPYLLQLMEKKFELMNVEPHLRSMDEQYYQPKKKEFI